MAEKVESRRVGLGSQLSKPALKSYSTEDIPNFCEGDGRGHNEHLHICTGKRTLPLGRESPLPTLGSSQGSEAWTQHSAGGKRQGEIAS